MTIWHDCTMTTLYHSADSSEDTACTVMIDDDGGFVQYRGRGDGKGHHELEGVGFAGRATLHRFPGSVILEGNWLEEGYRSMWYIRSNETGENRELKRANVLASKTLRAKSWLSTNALLPTRIHGSG